MKKRLHFNDTPVSELKIQMIQDILNNPTVNFYYHEWLRLKSISAPFKDIDRAFREYAKFRDSIGGIPPMVPIAESQSTNKKYLR